MATEAAPNATGKNTTNEVLASQVLGQTFTIPNLYLFFPDWDVVINPHFEEVREWFEGVWLQRWVKDPKIQYGFKKAAVPLYVSYMYPRVKLEELKGVNGLFAWFFFWDDLIDDGPISNDIEATAKYCSDTLAFIDSCLGDAEPPKDPPKAIPPIQCLWDVGVAVWHSCSAETRCRLRAEAIRFVRAAQESQYERVSIAKVPTVEEYEKRRGINVGTPVVSMFSEYAAHLKIPPEIFESDDLKTVVSETARLVWLVNDLISMKKEFSQHQFESLIPILLYSHHNNQPPLSPEAAISIASTKLHDSYANFRAAEQRLYNLSIEKKEVWGVDVDHVNEFVHCCKDLVMATVRWSYECRRYVKLEEINPETKEVMFTIPTGQEK